MFRLFEKIKFCRAQQVAWSRDVFGNTKHRLEAKQRALEELAGRGYGDNLVEINKVRGEINELLHQEEIFWRQRSRAIWLPAGDKNTKFFHRRASQRQRKNQIDGLTNDNGVWITEERNIGRVAEDYFQMSFSTSHLMGIKQA
ncbi:uncharacterized protein LOC142639710 [Castanea sativa]|uniref:uncharacterized protein LOC142639710 n=1 Tax=Castanea sativa TaxID=21020 RepID=UPI003F64E1CF